ncbi:hypothetical protein [Pseudomonas yamanorum]|uniref:hypothetical protein n=1 Tax=Pseudomonas yamanorum TaxID=515393 RepID=UPI003BA0A1A9
MKKDWVIWVGCIGLFFAGGIYFNMLPQLVWKRDIGISDLVAGASAVAAAFAAFAAWKSALISSEAASDSRVFSRMQAYIMHRQQFEALLTQIEKELSVRFKEKDGLYNDIFPNNRHLKLPFSMEANGEEFKAWSSFFKELLGKTNTYPAMGLRELKTWMVDQLMLTGNYLRFDFDLDSDIGVFIIEGIKTRVSMDDPMLSLRLASKVINHFSVFGMTDAYLGMSSPPEYFVDALKDLQLTTFTGGGGCQYREFGKS